MLWFIIVYGLMMKSMLFYQERDVKYFNETEENNQMRGPRTGVPYFL